MGSSSGVDELTGLHEGLNLTDQEAALYEIDLTHYPPPQPILGELQWILGATVLRHDKFSVDGFVQNMRSIWKPFKGVTVETIGNNLFCFRFNHERDLIRVLKGSPWHFEKHLVLLKQFPSPASIRREELTTCAFWVRVMGLSLLLISGEQARGIKAMMGSFMDYESDRSKIRTTSFLRIRVEVDVTKTIRRVLRLGKKDAFSFYKL